MDAKRRKKLDYRQEWQDVDLDGRMAGTKRRLAGSLGDIGK
jgi:hypothetical protein